MNTKLVVSCMLSIVWTAAVNAAEPTAPDYESEIAPLFVKYCAGCHNADDAEGELALDSFAGLQKGGSRGAAVVAGRSEQSRLLQMVKREVEPYMPPEGSEAPTADEIALLEAWIDAGAPGGDGQSLKLITPDVEPTGPVREPINALAYSPNGRWLAVARYQQVEILDAETRESVALLEGQTGNVNDVGFSADSSRLYTAAGEPGFRGEARLYDTADWSLAATFSGHRDSMYAADLSQDRKLLATGGYDKRILLWDTEGGAQVAALEGHNDAVFGVAFRPDGKVLASASGDRTVKLWDVATANRLETFAQPAKDQYATAFSPDGRLVVGGGVDSKIRVWRVSRKAREGTNPIRYARFAHEAPILNLVFSPDGRLLVSSSEDLTIKVWETKSFTQVRAIPRQPDWAPALAISPDSATLAVGRLDGTLATYSLRDAEDREHQSARPLAVGLTTATAIDAETAELSEREPNDDPAEATGLTAPAVVTGVLDPAEEAVEDADHYRFSAAAGQAWIIETKAARDGSPADTHVAVLNAVGEPVMRAQLQAVRDSWITFRPINSSSPDVRVEYWEEMDLNQFLYMNGEIARTYLMPRGPDSGFKLYANGGNRRCYFDTSAMTHAKDEPVYIVEPYPPGAELVDNGLPVFPLYYANDDDGERELGNDSRLTFIAPEDGDYLVRVTDVRGFGGEDFKYQLTIRPAAPDFAVTVPKNPNVPPGSGQRLKFTVDRQDNFDGEIRFDVAGAPPGFHVATPVVCEAGHLEANSVINADPDAEQPDQAAWEQVSITATAEIDGRTVTKPLGHLGEIKLAGSAKIHVMLAPDNPATTTADGGLRMAPGSTITAMLSIERSGYDGDVKFDVDGLPHGVIVDNIGLSGILIRKGETSRQIFLTASPWVEETECWIFAVAQTQGNQASRPLRLEVRARETARPQIPSARVEHQPQRPR